MGGATEDEAGEGGLTTKQAKVSKVLGDAADGGYYSSKSKSTKADAMLSSKVGKAEGDEGLLIQTSESIQSSWRRGGWRRRLLFFQVEVDEGRRNAVVQGRKSRR